MFYEICNIFPGLFIEIGFFSANVLQNSWFFSKINWENVLFFPTMSCQNLCFSLNHYFYFSLFFLQPVDKICNLFPLPFVEDYDISLWQIDKIRYVLAQPFDKICYIFFSIVYWNLHFFRHHFTKFTILFNKRSAKFVLFFW